VTELLLCYYYYYYYDRVFGLGGPRFFYSIRLTMAELRCLQPPATVKKHHPHRAIYGRIGVGAIGVGLAGQTVGWKTDGILISVEMDGRGVECVIIVTADGFDFFWVAFRAGCCQGSER
jgi:hypothetical protein